MNKKSIILVFIVIGIAVFGTSWFATRQRNTFDVLTFDECAAQGNPVGESYPRQCWTPDGKHFTETISEVPPSQGNITVTGRITCLPKSGNGPQTLECALGLKADDGRYYGLKNLSTHDPSFALSSPDILVEVTGTLYAEELRGPDGNAYTIEGSIDITSVKKL